jgi:hypothetical protein
MADVEARVINPGSSNDWAARLKCAGVLVHECNQA